MPPTGSNLHGLDYRVEAARLPAPCSIIDIHAHINGRRASLIYRQAAELYGVSRVYTQVRLGEASNVRAALGDYCRFVAFPDFRSQDRAHAMTRGYLDDIRAFHGEHGARIVKFWNAPRLRDYFQGPGASDIVELDGAWRVRHAELAMKLGMMFMVHVADPDTWFRTAYADAKVYGVKRDHYRGLEVMLDRFPAPWIAAHMGGWPEDLDFLDGLMERHANLYLDTSATKWMVRELSAHPRERAAQFFDRWRGRILFGSDIVALDEHTGAAAPAGVRPSTMADLASSPEGAFDLYASRYWALRTLFETRTQVQSPIADPDLSMVNPGAFTAHSSPMLKGIALGAATLGSIYKAAAERILGD